MIWVSASGAILPAPVAPDGPQTPTESAVASPAHAGRHQVEHTAASERVQSVDVLRGFDMFWISGGDHLFHALAIATGWSGVVFLSRPAQTLALGRLHLLRPHPAAVSVHHRNDPAAVRRAPPGPRANAVGGLPPPVDPGHLPGDPGTPRQERSHFLRRSPYPLHQRAGAHRRGGPGRRRHHHVHPRARANHVGAWHSDRLLGVAHLCAGPGPARAELQAGRQHR